MLTLVACGLGNDAIALRLDASRRTVSTHVERILGKLGQPNRAAPPRWPSSGACCGCRWPARRAWAPAPRPSRASPLPGAPPPAPRPPRRRPFVVGSLIPLAGPGMADGHEMLGGATLRHRARSTPAAASAAGP